MFVVVKMQLGVDATIQPGAYTARTATVATSKKKNTTFKPGSLHHAAEFGLLAEFDQHIREGLKHGYPESVICQEREDVLGEQGFPCLVATRSTGFHAVFCTMFAGMMPIHIAAEKGRSDVVEVSPSTVLTCAARAHDSCV